jgi:hypothetical protein
MYNTGFDKLEQILAQQAQILKNQETLAQEFKTQIAQLIALVQTNGTKKKPGPVLFIIAGEDPMADKILFRVVLPEPSAADVTTRELTVDIDGVTQVLTLCVNDTNPLEFSGAQGAQVCVSLVDIDDAGNRSAAASMMPQQLTDNFAPPAPGDLGFEIIGESPDDTIVISDEDFKATSYSDESSDEEVESDISTSDTVDDLDVEFVDDSDEFSIG